MAKIKKSIIFSLVVLGIISAFLIYKTFPKNNDVLEEAKLQENIINSDSFALMLQKSDLSGYYESDSSVWPTNMNFNSELSGCIDINGNKIDGSLTYDSNNNLVTVSTNKTSYCYVYFDITSTQYLVNTVSSDMLWDSTLENDGYRYVGTSPNNYICFGTTNKNLCTSDTDKYMYRIIGIFEDSDGKQHLKLIKKDPLSGYAWNEGMLNDNDYEDSNIDYKLDGTEFYTSYIRIHGDTWVNKINSWNYVTTNTLTYESSGPDYNIIKSKAIYYHELNLSQKVINTEDYYGIGKYSTVNRKIALMYVSDYLLSLGSTALNLTSNSNADTLKTSWMHLSNSGYPSSYEWTMTRAGYNNIIGYYVAWYIASNGAVSSASDDGVVANSYPVRPVFYLKSDVEFADNPGDGSITNPYIIKE